VKVRKAEGLFPFLNDLVGFTVGIAFEILLKDPDGLGRKRAVYVDREVGDALHEPLVLDLADEIEKLLGPADGKGRDDDVAPS
jgi:hypothetical protein